MSFARGDFRRLGTSLAVALVMFALGAVIAWQANRALHDARSLRAEAARQRDKFEDKLGRVHEEESEIRRQAALFTELRTRGIVGEEQRLEWIELIERIRVARRLLDLHYEFLPQQPLAATMPSGDGFRSSAMRLRMKLLHEGDLLNFVDDLHAHARAHVRVRSCKVLRGGRGAPAVDAPLDADCELDWITILPARADR